MSSCGDIAHWRNDGVSAGIYTSWVIHGTIQSKDRKIDGLRDFISWKSIEMLLDCWKSLKLVLKLSIRRCFKNEKIVNKTPFAYLLNASMDLANFFRIYSQSITVKHILLATTTNDFEIGFTRAIRQESICAIQFKIQHQVLWTKKKNKESIIY